MDRPEHRVLAGRYILDGKTPVPCPDIVNWGEWCEKLWLARQVAETEPLPGVRVSTVFLGIDHNFVGAGPPILFETMVFGGPLNQVQVRYSTWEEAEAGHRVWVERVKDPGPWIEEADASG